MGLVIVVLVECVATAAVFGVQAGLWSLTSLVAIQMGYLGGVYARSILEKTGLLAEPETLHQAHPVATTTSACGDAGNKRAKRLAESNTVYCKPVRIAAR